MYRQDKALGPLARLFSWQLKGEIPQPSTRGFVDFFDVITQSLEGKDLDILIFRA